MYIAQNVGLQFDRSEGPNLMDIWDSALKIYLKTVKKSPTLQFLLGCTIN